ncbi:hypothetical protein GUJ93_ZPchr0008g12768 [Zizania palustris]|uniref:Uncharacterized protein n=1 Tax=Zizania palustris TaxID=103762 RepID=A0A8J5R960_ZIZPA|nr:hypothetical protein GUJ93_ZPchr0008g12768 [Zizania palustris]
MASPVDMNRPEMTRGEEAQYSGPNPPLRWRAMRTYSVLDAIRVLRTSGGYGASSTSGSDSGSGCGGCGCGCGPCISGIIGGIGTSSTMMIGGCTGGCCTSTAASVGMGALRRADEGDLATQSLRAENESLRHQLQEAQARLASTRTGPRIRRTARKATGRLPRLQHQPPQPASTPAEPRSPADNAEDIVRDIEMIP